MKPTRVETVRLRSLNLEIAVMSDGTVSIYHPSAEDWAVRYDRGDTASRFTKTIKLQRVQPVPVDPSWAVEALSQTLKQPPVRSSG